MNRTVAFPTLGSAVTPRATTSSVLLVLAGAALIAASGQVEVPMWPVPITLQTLAVLLVGAALGSRRGLASVLTYLMVAAAGLPVLAGGVGGVAKLVGPTGGYLLGFAVAAFLVGWLVERFALDRTVRGTVLAMLVGNVVIYALGLAWLAAVVPALRSAEPLLAAGLTPFLLGDAVKIAVAAALLPVAWRFVGRR